VIGTPNQVLAPKEIEIVMNFCDKCGKCEKLLEKRQFLLDKMTQNRKQLLQICYLITFSVDDVYECEVLVVLVLVHV
jgi:Zn-dependent alcohol dehydrogenase